MLDDGFLSGLEIRDWLLRFTGKENCLQSQWDFDIMGLQACRSVSVKCKWEIPANRIQSEIKRILNIKE